MKHLIESEISVSKAWTALALMLLLPLGTGLDRAAAASPSDASSASGDSSGVESVWDLPEPRLAFGIREGQQLFLHYCATCHGEEGAADGFNAYNLDPRPRDLSDAEFQANRSDAELYELIRLGGGAAGLSATMPPWGRTIDERGLNYLVRFVRHLARHEPSVSGSEPVSDEH